jgi:hypothetical protein
VTELPLRLEGESKRVAVETAIIAGWTGRDLAALEAHMAELEELGVRRPSSAPIFYRVSAARLTTATEIESTEDSSGEVEAVLLNVDGGLWLGVGSDHTDRRVETYDVAVSKQMCEKPLAAELWRYEDVADHWDRLSLRSWIDEEGREVLYQEGTLGSMLPPGQLLEAAVPPIGPGTAMFCGTFAAVGGIRPSSRFRYELEDPVLGRRIEGWYSMRSLPIVA